jgi:hypothetical protein
MNKERKMVSPTVKLSPYERALNKLNELPLPLYKIFAEALGDMKRQRDEALASVTSARREGAELMRAASMKACLGIGYSESYYAPTLADDCAEAIKDISLPEIESS